MLCNPAPGVDPSRAGVLNERADLAERDGMRGRCSITLDKSYPPELSDRATYESYRGRYLANDPVGFGFGFRMLARTNMLHLLPLIRCPTMVVAGRHDTVRPPAGTAELAKKIPGARFELIETAGISCRPGAGRRCSRCCRTFCRDEPLHSANHLRERTR